MILKNSDRLYTLPKISVAIKKNIFKFIDDDRAKIRKKQVCGRFKGIYGLKGLKREKLKL